MIATTPAATAAHDTTIAAHSARPRTTAVIARRGARMLSALVLALAAACAPRLRPLGGAPAPATLRLPTPALPAGHRRVVFDWTLDDADMAARGQGVARMASPDSARLDFFLRGGIAGGWAILVGDTLRAPGPDRLRDMLPPVPMLWAALGRMALPASADTTIAQEGDLLRADLGHPIAWRVTFRGDTLVRLEHVSGGRVVEWVDRANPTRVVYRREVPRRELTLILSGPDEPTTFDPSIWSR